MMEINTKESNKIISVRCYFLMAKSLLCPVAIQKAGRGLRTKPLINY